jgi:hypothetical protein
MAPGRKLQFYHPDPPAMRRRHRAFGQDDGYDSAEGGSDFGGDPYAGDTSTPVSEITVTAAAPTSIDVQPQPSLLSPDISLSPPAPLDISGFESILPNLNVPGAASNPITNLLKKLLPAPAKPGGGGGGAGAPKLQPSTPVPKPAASTSTGATALNPMVLLGAGLAGLVLLAAALSGHHDRRASGGRR